MTKEPRSVVVKTLVVDEEPAEVIEYFLDLRNWESEGSVKNVRKVDDEWWEANTPLGRARIRLRPDKQAGTFDRDFSGGGGEWMVFCRVAPNARGSTALWLFARPDGMPQEEFESQLGSNFDKEMDGYKNGIESRRGRRHA
jgi:hypothetical protein